MDFSWVQAAAESSVIPFTSSYLYPCSCKNLINIHDFGCGFEAYKLLIKRKKGPDSYIATRAGALFGANRCKNAVLVSNDTRTGTRWTATSWRR